MTEAIYARLAQHLDNLPGGFPRSETGVEMRILRRLFTEEEAELAVHLSLRPEPAAKVAARLDRDPEKIASLLHEMSHKGLIFRLSKGKTPLYMASQYVIGIWEYHVNDLDPDLAIFMILTPFPGTEIFEEAKRNGWIEDWNWANYDMVHAIMPTETLSINEVQEELYKCYRSFFGSWNRRFKGLFSGNEIRRRVYWYMATRGIVKQLRGLY